MYYQEGFFLHQNIGIENEIHKAILVVQEHKDKDKPYLAHKSSTLKHLSLRIICFYTSIMNHQL